MVDTVRIGGIKLSGELAQLDFLGSELPDEQLIEVLRGITSAKVNIPHLHQGKTSAVMQTTFCLAVEDFRRLQVDTVVGSMQGWSRILPSVGTLSLFPHGYDLSLMARVVHALTEAKIPIYGLSISVSALVIHTDYALLDSAVTAVMTICKLPENHTPFRPVVVLGDEAVETIAVYWEPRIRIYGMDVKPGLEMLRLEAPVSLLKSALWQRLALLQGKIRLLIFQSVPKERVVCTFCVERQWSSEILAVLQQAGEEGYNCQPVVEDGVDLVSFHGPHFQDRYGIAGLTYSELRNNGFGVLASACTGTSVQLVTAKDSGKSVARCLKKICVIPSGDAY